MALGSKRKGQGWRIGIKNPQHPDQIAKVVELSDQAIATSGNYEQYFLAKSSGKVYHHLLHPTFAAPGRTDHFQSLTVIAKNGCDADALATSVFLMEEAEGHQWIQNHIEGASSAFWLS